MISLALALHLWLAQQKVEPPAVMWFVTVPKLTFEGPLGWHETIVSRDQGWKYESIPEALSICRKHKWGGYIRWRSYFGQETDSCRFMRIGMNHAMLLQTVPSRTHSRGEASK